MARNVEIHDWITYVPKSYDNHLCPEHGEVLSKNGDGYQCAKCEPETRHQPITWESRGMSGRELRRLSLASASQEQASEINQGELLLATEARLFDHGIRNVRNYAVTYIATDGERTRVVITDGATLHEHGEPRITIEARKHFDELARLAPALGGE